MAVTDRFHAVDISIEPDHREPDLRFFDGKGQADIADADDGDSCRSFRDLLDQQRAPVVRCRVLANASYDGSWPPLSKNGRLPPSR